MTVTEVHKLLMLVQQINLNLCDILTMHTAENTGKREESEHNRTKITGIEERIHTYVHTYIHGLQ